MRLLNTIQDNVQYRISSFRAMLVGSSGVARAEPLERRKEIMRRRREAVTGALDDDEAPDGEGAEVSASNTDNGGTATRSRSGMISDQTQDDRPRSYERGSGDRSRGTTITSNIPSMSETNRGTVERARERGYSQ